MTAHSLAASLIRQARQRLALVETARAAGAHHIAVREAQEVVELALKGLLRAAGIEPAKVHDVSRDILTCRERLLACGVLAPEQLAEDSRRLRKEREAAFYGDVDLIPEEVYTPRDSEAAWEAAQRCVREAERMLARAVEE